MEDKIWYAVLKLSTDVTYTNLISGREVVEKIQGIAGFIPCYETYEEALDASMNMRYKIAEFKQEDK